MEGLINGNKVFSDDKKYKTNHKNKVINSSCDFWEYKPINVSEVVSLFNEVSS